MNRKRSTILGVLGLLNCLHCGTVHSAETIRFPENQLRDKIHGGLLGQVLGNLNGLLHELKCTREPGKVTDYVPSLREGAWTDDDTDFEWVYIVEMQRRGQILLPPDAIAKLWRARINRRIWCSNQYARQLMDLGIEPPWTGSALFNPWAGLSISGQFLCETFGLIAPAMPQNQPSRVQVVSKPACNMPRRFAPDPTVCRMAA